MENPMENYQSAPLVCTRGVIVFPNQEIIIDVGREKSIRAVEDGRQLFERRVVLVSQRDLTIEDPGMSDLYGVGTLCEIRHIRRLDGYLRVKFRGVCRCELQSVSEENGCQMAGFRVLNDNVPANFLILLAAGAIMILTLWTSKKAMHVTETELSLSAQGDEGTEQYGSSVLSRTIVRAALNINAGIERVIPPRVRAAISRRFEYEDIEHSGAPYDMIRATVNLTTSAMLIAIATSLKLPLSTTYVCFMVAMGSSLADRAWGRESAVYRFRAS